MAKLCKNCEAPVDPGASHTNAGDCRSAQRKEIKRLRSTVSSLQMKMREYEQLYDQALRAFQKGAGN